MEVLESFTFNWHQVVVDLIRVAIAFILALPIGWERSQAARRYGLRTFPIVAIASCGFVLVAKQIPGASADSMTRALQGILGGIGFVGGGAILKERGSIYGLATAASLWNTGAIGASVAFEREEIAVVLSLINFALLRLLTPVAATDAYQQSEEAESEDKA
jgi:putative Mg2+ transporter-C (MgtC) family protein